MHGLRFQTTGFGEESAPAGARDTASGMALHQGEAELGLEMRMLLSCAHPVACRIRFAGNTEPEAWTHKEPADADSLAEDMAAPLPG